MQDLNCFIYTGPVLFDFTLSNFEIDFCKVIKFPTSSYKPNS